MVYGRVPFPIPVRQCGRMYFGAAQGGMSNRGITVSHHTNCTNCMNWRKIWPAAGRKFWSGAKIVISEGGDQFPQNLGVRTTLHSPLVIGPDRLEGGGGGVFRIPLIRITKPTGIPMNLCLCFLLVLSLLVVNYIIF